MNSTCPSVSFSASNVKTYSSQIVHANILKLFDRSGLFYDLLLHMVYKKSRGLRCRRLLELRISAVGCDVYGHPFFRNCKKTK